MARRAVGLQAGGRRTIDLEVEIEASNGVPRLVELGGEDPGSGDARERQPPLIGVGVVERGGVVVDQGDKRDRQGLVQTTVRRADCEVDRHVDGGPAIALEGGGRVARDCADPLRQGGGHRDRRLRAVGPCQADKAFGMPRRTRTGPSARRASTPGSRSTSWPRARWVRTCCSTPSAASSRSRRGSPTWASWCSRTLARSDGAMPGGRGCAVLAEQLCCDPIDANDRARHRVGPGGRSVPAPARGRVAPVDGADPAVLDVDGSSRCSSGSSPGRITPFWRCSRSRWRRCRGSARRSQPSP